jgi:hypothetical protein
MNVDKKMMHSSALFSACFLSALSTNALAQIDSDSARCPELQSASMKVDAKVCHSQPACNRILKLQRTCAASVEYLVRLRETSGRFPPTYPGTPSLEAIFEAAITPQLAWLEEFEQGKELLKQVRALPMGRQLVAQGDNVYYGDVRNGLAHGNGYLIKGFSVSRGSFKNGFRQGLNEYIVFNDTMARAVAEFDLGHMSGPAVIVLSDHNGYTVGRFSPPNTRLTGVSRRTEDNELQDGVWVGGKFVFGTKLDKNGRTEVWGRPDPKVSTLELAKAWSSAKFDAGQISVAGSTEPTAVYESGKKVFPQPINAADGLAPPQSCGTKYSLPFARKSYAAPMLSSWSTK